MTSAEMAYTLSASDTAPDDEHILKELPQVYYIAARIRERLPNHVDMEDLVSAGIVGLMEASRTFDSKKDTQFGTYAKFRIRGAILDSLRELDWGSRLLRRRGREIGDATARLESRLGRHPAETEIAEEMRMSVDQLQQIRTQLSTSYVAGQLSYGEEDCDVIDLIESAPDFNEPDPFDLCLEGERKVHLAEAIARLSEREQLILSLYYREELTMKEIAQVVGLAVSRISQIHQAAIQRLREDLMHLEQRSPRLGGDQREALRYAW